MPLPTLKVQIAFASTPLSTTPTWVDVSSSVRIADGVRIRRGNLTADPQGSDSAGSFEFTLNDRVRLFDPTYAAGTYFGQMTPRKQVRFLATHGGVDYPLFYGWTTGFKCESRNMGKDAVTVVTGYDALGALAGRRLVGDALADYVDATFGANAYVWLRNVDGEQWVDRQTGSADGVGTSTTAAQTTTSLVGSLKSNAWQSNGGSFYTLPLTSLSNAATGLLAFWLQTTVSGSEFASGVAPIIGSNFYSTGVIGITSAGVLKVGVGAGGDAVFTSVINDGFPHFICIVSGGLSASLYVDAVLDSTQAWNGYSHDIIGRTGAAAACLKSTAVQDILNVRGVAVTAATVKALYDLSRGLAVESTSTRVTRLLDEADWPSAWRTITTAPRGECGPIAFNGQAVLTGLQEVERTEQGRMYAALDGKITFRTRYYAYEDTVSNTAQVTFSDDGANESYRTFGHRRADEDVVNDATVSNGSTESRSTDATSQSAYDTNANTYQTVLSTYEQCKQMAAGIVWLYKDVRTRLDPIQLQNTATSWPGLLGLELASRVRIESTPMGVGAQMVEEVLVESIGWDITDEWKYTLAGSPVPPAPATVGFWSLDVSVLDTSTVLAY